MGKCENVFILGIWNLDSIILCSKLGQQRDWDFYDPTKAIPANKPAVLDSPTRAKQRKWNLQVWGSGQKQETLRWGLFFPVHLKITLRGLSLDHPTWNQSWRANSYLCNTRGTELVLNALTWNTRIPVLATARLILVPSRSLAGCNRTPYISSLRAISRSWKSDSAGVCPLTKQKFKRKARRFEFSVSMNSRLSIFSSERKRHFITNNGATRSDDTRPPIHYNPKLSNWNKSSIACVTQNPQKSISNSASFLESQRVSFKVI